MEKTGKAGIKWSLHIGYLLVQLNEFRTLGKDSVRSLCMQGVLKQIDHWHVEKQQFSASSVPIFLSAVSPSLRARPPPIFHAWNANTQTGSKTAFKVTDTDTGT